MNIKTTKHFKAKHISGLSAVALALTGGLAGCGTASGSTGAPKNITIATQDFSEPVIDDYMIKDMIEANSDVKVTIKQTSGASGLMHSMLMKNDIQLYTGWDGTEFSGPLKQSYSGDFKGHPDKVYNYVKDQEMKQYNAWVSPSLGYQDTYALAVRASDAKKYNLTKDSQVMKYAPNWVVATDPTFQSRKGDGMADFVKDYGFQFKSAKAMSPDLMYPALAKGSVDAGVMYSTDGRMKKLDLVPLQDDKNFFPPYNAVIVANAKVEKELNLDKILKPLFGAISTADQTELNYEVDVQHKDAATVAHDFLVKKGLLKK